MFLESLPQPIQPPITFWRIMLRNSVETPLELFKGGVPPPYPPLPKFSKVQFFFTFSGEKSKKN